MFTDDISQLREAERFRDDAIADGWSIEPTYGKTEPVEYAAKLFKQGWQMQVITRDNIDKGYKKRYDVSVNIWTPEGLAVRLPGPVYDWQALLRTKWTCSYCGEYPVRVHRVGFAGSSCADCLPEQRKKQEYDGWTK